MFISPLLARYRPRSRVLRVLLSLGAAGAVTAGIAAVTPAAAATPSTGIGHRAVCEAPTAHRVACLSGIYTDAAGRPLDTKASHDTGYVALSAADLQSAYRLPSGLLGGRQTIAVVTAFDDPVAEADLAVYRAANHLPECTTANGCFRKVNQDGGSAPPVTDSSWGVETSLDLDMVSATCPNCSLLLVEADENTLDNVGKAAARAAAMGADVVSNSYGVAEFAGETGQFASYYDHPGTAMIAAAGDGGFGVSVPAALPTVVAVGATQLYKDSSPRGWGEVAWNLTGSGCSAYVAKPSWQKDKLCGKRTVNDVSAVGAMATPVGVYDTFDMPGWLAVYGSSVSAPVVAGVYALAGNAAQVDAVRYPYAHTGNLFDITSGSNGSCGGSYLCNSGRGYDGPTGNGTPDGIGAF